MRIKRFEWDNVNIEHISKHTVTPDEAEEVFADDAAIFLRSHSGRFIALGQTEAGRYLTVVYERKTGAIRVITALDMDEKNRKRYRRERRS